MINIAIVEDEKKARELLISYIGRYYGGDADKFCVKEFDRAEPFVYNYKADYDIIFMDIELPGMNGMEASQHIRKVDSVVTIIFVTNMAQFAVKGYEVAAFDFVVKPISYADFALKFKRAESAIFSRRDVDIIVPERFRITRISSGDVMYVEVKGHYLYYHTVTTVLKCPGVMAELEKQLSTKNFMRCNSCYLVNPRFIEGVAGNSVFMRGGEELMISRQRKKPFMVALTAWLGDGNKI